MKMWLHLYTLTPLKNLNAQTSTEPRKGALLKVEWALDRVGYSDLFPWGEFGDPALSDLLKDLQGLQLSSPLLTRSLERNAADAKARFQRRSLFKALVSPESHGLLTSLRDFNLKKEMGFSVFKLKLSGEIKKDTSDTQLLLSHLKSHERLRLDINGSYTFNQFQNFIDEIKPGLHLVDLIEDPWKGPTTGKLSSQVLSKLAGDFLLDPLWPHRVVKPAREDIPVERSFSGKQILTHSMDHPLGQAFALWETALYERHFPHRKTVHGVARPQIYKSTDFDWSWEGFGPRPSFPKGYGIGFDDVLHSLRWETL